MQSNLFSCVNITTLWEGLAKDIKTYYTLKWLTPHAIDLANKQDNL